VVVNAGCADKDIAHIAEHLKSFKGEAALDVSLNETHSLLALQGPKSSQVLSKFVKPSVVGMKFMTGVRTPVDGVEGCRVTRCGYTGEDGFEISVPSRHVETFARRLLAVEGVEPIGLAVRDSLRLEAGLCLYGNDIDETTTPIEAGLTWTISKRRRAEGGFLGEKIILGQLNNKIPVERRRVGFAIEKGIARAGAKLFTSPEDKESIGIMCSGGWSPSLKKGIGMAYVQDKYASKEYPADKFVVDVRGKFYPAVRSKMPFVPTGYYKG